MKFYRISRGAYLRGIGSNIVIFLYTEICKGYVRKWPKWQIREIFVSRKFHVLQYFVRWLASTEGGDSHP